MSISFTEIAISRLSTLLVTYARDHPQSPPPQGIRLGVVDGGCQGYQYALHIVNNPKEEDFVLVENSLAVYISPQNMPLLDGVVVDFVNSLRESGFTFTNPKTTKTCSCGKSWGSKQCNPNSFSCN